MESNMHTEAQNQEEILFRDTRKEAYWSNKYDISAEELKEPKKIELSALIIEAGIKHKCFQSLAF